MKHSGYVVRLSQSGKACDITHGLKLIGGENTKNGLTRIWLDGAEFPTLAGATFAADTFGIKRCAERCKLSQQHKKELLMEYAGQQLSDEKTEEESYEEVAL